MSMKHKADRKVRITRYRLGGLEVSGLGLQAEGRGFESRSGLQSFQACI